MMMITKIMLFLFLGAATDEKLLSNTRTRPNTGQSGPSPSLTEEGTAAATVNKRYIFGHHTFRNIGAVLLLWPLIYLFLPNNSVT